MPRSEAFLDAPRAYRRVAYRGAFSDHLGGVAFVAGVAQSGMPEGVLARLVGIGLPLDDLGPWVDAPLSIAALPAPDAPSAALPSEPAPDDAPVVSPAHVARPAPSASPPQHRHRRR